MTDKIIMFDSDEAAIFKENISGWVSPDGHFFGKNEDVARWSGCTHKTCSCGEVMSKHYTICESCRSKKYSARYEGMKEEVWNGEPLVVYGTDRYFFNEDDVYEYVEECGKKPHYLVICKPTFASYIEEYAIDDLPEDMTVHDADAGLGDLIDQVNKYIDEKKPILSWHEGDTKAKVGTKAKVESQ